MCVCFFVFLFFLYFFMGTVTAVQIVKKEREVVILV